MRKWYLFQDPPSAGARPCPPLRWGSPSCSSWRRRPPQCSSQAGSCTKPSDKTKYVGLDSLDILQLDECGITYKSIFLWCIQHLTEIMNFFSGKYLKWNFERCMLCWVKSKPWSHSGCILHYTSRARNVALGGKWKSSAIFLSKLQMSWKWDILDTGKQWLLN